MEKGPSEADNGHVYAYSTLFCVGLVQNTEEYEFENFASIMDGQQGWFEGGLRGLICTGTPVSWASLAFVQLLSGAIRFLLMAWNIQESDCTSHFICHECADYLLRPAHTLHGVGGQERVFFCSVEVEIK